MNSIRQKTSHALTKLGEFLLKSRRDAIIVAMLTAVIPYLGWFSLAVVAFITLRKGIKEGLLVLCWSVIPAVFSAYAMTGFSSMSVETLALYILVWALAWLLRTTASWSYILEASFGFAIIIIGFFYWLIPDLNEVYTGYLMDLYRNSGTGAESYADAQTFIEQISQYLLGVQATLYILQCLVVLIIARGLQALMFNPGGLSLELRTIRLSWVSLLIALVCLGLSLKVSYAWALGTWPAFAMLFLIAGFSVVHYSIKQKIRFRGATLLFYVVFVLLFPFSVIPIILLAWIDTVWNVRRFL